MYGNDAMAVIFFMPASGFEPEYEPPQGSRISKLPHAGIKNLVFW